MAYLSNHTPYKKWYSRKLNLSHLHKIGCHAFILIQNHHNPKIFNCSTECILIGYSLDSKAYRCYHCASHKVFVSHNVSFIKSFNDHHTPLHPGNSVSNPPAASRPDAPGQPSTFSPCATVINVPDEDEPPFLLLHHFAVPPVHLSPPRDNVLLTVLPMF
jgi:hypothetical protein